MAKKAAGKRVDVLTARFLESTKTPGLFGDGGNLFLKVDASGNKSWIVRWQGSDGKQRKLGLGPVHTVSLAEARDKAADVRKLILAGIDPRQARQEVKVAAAVAEAKALTSTSAQRNSSGHTRPDGRTASTPTNGKRRWRPMRALYSVRSGGRRRCRLGDGSSGTDLGDKKRDGASGTRARRERSGLGQGPRVSDRRIRRDGKAISTSCFPRGVRSARSSTTPPCPLTSCPPSCASCASGTASRPSRLSSNSSASRTSEALGARWSEVDIENLTSSIPPERMKGGKLHRVPLSDRAVEIIEDMATDKRGEFIFPGAKRGKPLSNMALLLLLRRMKRGDLTARLQKQFPHMGGGANELRTRDRRSRPRPRCWRRNRAQLSARRFARQATATDERMGGVL